MAHIASDYPAILFSVLSWYQAIFLKSLASPMWHSSGQQADQVLRTEHSVPLLTPTPIPSLDLSFILLPSAQGRGTWHQQRGTFLLCPLCSTSFSPMSSLWPLLPAGAGSAQGPGARFERHLCGLVCA